MKTESDVKDMLAGASMNVTYNGTTATIKMPEKGTDEYNEIFVNSTDKKDAAQKMQDYLQTQFDQAFGHNRINVQRCAVRWFFRACF